MRLLTIAVFIALVSCSLAAFPQHTNTLHGQLGQCVAKTQSDIDCIETVKRGLQKISDYIAKLRKLKNQMRKINNGLNTFNVVLKVAKYAPGIGGAVNILKISLRVIRFPFTRAYNKVKALDAKVWPWKRRVDAGIRKCDQAVEKITIVQNKCQQGQTAVGRARRCIKQMPRGNLKRTLGNSLETLSRTLNPSFRAMLQALGRVGQTCSAIRRVTDLALRWPNIGPIVGAIDGFFNLMKPILDFFAKLQGVLNRRLCMPDPLEPGRELARKTERAREAGVRLARERLREANLRERAREVKIRLERGKEHARRLVEQGKERARRFARERAREARDRARRWARERKEEISERTPWGKRKRSLAKISKEEANTYLRLNKRGQVCFSIQQILDGVNSIFKPLLSLANKAIDALMKNLPPIRLPGLPNFAALLNFNINFNLPNIRFGLDLGFFNKFVSLRWNCAAQAKNVCSARRGAISFNCALSLNAFGKK